MKRKGLISLGHTLFSNVINFNKKSKQPQVSLPLIYAGSWQFTDELSNRTHCLEITTDLRILIDHRELAGQVQTLTAKELIFWMVTATICGSMPLTVNPSASMTKLITVSMS